jgi:hypothetical protein
VRSSQIRVSHSIDTVALSDADCFPAINTRQAINANSVAVNSEALGKRCRGSWHAGFANAQKGDSKDKGESPLHNHLLGLTLLVGTLKQTLGGVDI